MLDLDELLFALPLLDPAELVKGNYEQKSNMWENKPDETKYIYRDFDSEGQQLHGRTSYAITFPKGRHRRSGGSGPWLPD